MPKRSLVNLSHEHPSTFNMGEMIPAAVYRVAPGDVIRQNTSALVRTQPLLAPVMHKVNVDIRHFFVPDRLVWDEFEEFVGSGDDGDLAPTPPYITSPVSTGFAIGSLADYFGITPGVASRQVSALPFRAYALIFNEYFRDEQLQTPLVIAKTSGADTTTSVALQHGCWQKDYFTAARPAPQLGAEVTIPLTGDAPVYGTGKTLGMTDGTTIGALLAGAGGPTSVWQGAYNQNLGGINASGTNIQSKNLGVVTSGVSGLEADLSDVSAVNIEDLRFASALQRWKEILNRGGSRFPEVMRSMFGVRPQDARLQLPEYLGGGHQVIQFSEVLQTAEGTDPVGELRGHGIAAGRSNRFKYRSQEFGWVITLMIVRPKTVYMQSVHRSWFLQDRYELLWPQFAQLGDQEVYNRELNFGHVTPDGVFGYSPRYDDWRTVPNRVSGEFRDTLDYWHMARDVPTDAALNATFVKSDPTDRIYATDADQLQVRFIHDIKVKRCIPKPNQPGRLM